MINCIYVIDNGNWSSASGYEAARKLFTKYPELDAIFAGNDQMSLGAYAYIYDRGLVIPDDIGVMGFDNLAESEYFHPSLTTIQHDHIRVGTLAVKELIRIIDAIEDNQAVEYRVIRLEPELLVRESSTGVK